MRLVALSTIAATGTGKQRAWVATFATSGGLVQRNFCTNRLGEGIYTSDTVGEVGEFVGDIYLLGGHVREKVIQAMLVLFGGAAVDDWLLWRGYERVSLAVAVEYARECVELGVPKIS